MTQQIEFIELAALFTPIETFGNFLYVENPQASLWLNGRLLVIPVPALEDGDALDAVKKELFANVNIPYHTADAVYAYTFHIFNKPYHQLAVQEMMALNNIIGQIHQRYGQPAVKENI